MSVRLSEHQRNLLLRLEGVRVAVVGDAMLDVYVQGKVRRISPEAPVPVLSIERRTSALGGAANVALNVVGLGGWATLICMLGEDAVGAELRALATQRGLSLDGAVSVPGRPTTVKTRVIAGPQQLLRMDTEDTRSLPEAAQDNVVAALMAALDRGLDAVILSDYAKGVLSPSVCRRAIAACIERGVPVLVDPKNADFSHYAGATAITPNAAETQAVLGDTGKDETRLEERARALAMDLGLEALVMTRGEEGISVFGPNETLHSPARALQVFDVSGAGDTVVAMLSAARGRRLAWRDAVELANVAAAVVVGKVGTVPIDRHELLALEGHEDRGVSAPTSAEEVVETVRRWQSAGQRVVFTNGCFDLLHAGHVSYLNAARQLGDRLVVGLNTDASVRRLKGPSRPVNSEQHRAAVLGGLASVDRVVLFDDDTPLALIRSLRPDVLCKGADYQEALVVGAAEVKSWGGDVKLLPLVEGLSTTNLIARSSAFGKRP